MLPSILSSNRHANPVSFSLGSLLTSDKLFEKHGVPKSSVTSSTNIPELRAKLLAAKRAFTISNTSDEATYVEVERDIPVRDGSSITVRIHSPKSPPKDGSPIFVVYHGGGYALGGLDNETLLCRDFTELGGVAVNVDYRLAPENPFPVPVNDAYDALKWVLLLVVFSKQILIISDSRAFRRAGRQR